jgi:hypothetical protein
MGRRVNQEEVAEACMHHNICSPVQQSAAALGARLIFALKVTLKLRHCRWAALRLLLLLLRPSATPDLPQAGRLQPLSPSAAAVCVYFTIRSA